jgi:hypothetical protein
MPRKVGQETSVKTGKGGVHAYGPLPSSRAVLSYFKAWGQEKLPKEQIVELDTKTQTAMLVKQKQPPRQALAATTVEELLRNHRSEECPDFDRPLELRIVQRDNADMDGVEHVLLQDGHGRLQHMMARLSSDGSVSATAWDPPACRKSNVEDAEIASLLDGGPDDIVTDKLTGEMEPLALGDQLVQDCGSLFHRTVQENCQRDMTLKVLAARSFIIDGLAVELEAQICDRVGTDSCFVHHPKCAFEVPPSPDASFFQGESSPRRRDAKTLPQEQGAIATLIMHTPLCEADRMPGVSGSALEKASLMEKYRMGELSRYKGYEHINDDIPKWGALQVKSLRAEVDFRAVYPSCFPALDDKGPGTEVVRNQGLCGSCWAFASASATMNNLCIISAAAHSLRSASDRLEVSTQKIMSCKPEGQDDMQGCGGGSMHGFDSSARTWGLTHEKNNPYQCGSGNPLNHFDQVDATCEEFPWGGSCYGSSDPKWFWGGSASVSGEDIMMTYISEGFSLYASIDTYSNFMSLRDDSIYSATEGSVKGGHAIVIIGYGAQGGGGDGGGGAFIESGTKYWHIQNSWGTNWGNKGFAKFLRGTNLAGIEENAFLARAWAEGVSEMPCMDGIDGTGLSTSDGKIPCDQAVTGSFGNLCTSSAYGARVSRNCMKTCDSCAGFNGAVANPSPSPFTADDYATCVADLKEKILR